MAVVCTATAALKLLHQIGTMTCQTPFYTIAVEPTGYEEEMVFGRACEHSRKPSRLQHKTPLSRTT